MGEFAFSRSNHMTQVRNVAIVLAPAARQFPNPRDRLQLRAGGGKVIQCEEISVLFPPIRV